MRQQPKETPKRAQWVLAIAGIAALAVVLLLLGRGAAEEKRDAQLRAAYRSVLSSTPGIVVTSIERAGERYVINGLRDPRAAPPAFVIAAAGLPAATLDLAAYQSPDPQLTRQQDAMAAVADAIRSLEQLEVAFEQGASDLPHPGAVARAAELIHRAQRAATLAGVALCVEVLGDSDSTGSEQRNASIRAARALSVARALELAGVDGALLTPRAGDPLRPRPHARRVTFRAALRLGSDQRGCPR